MDLAGDRLREGAIEVVRTLRAAGFQALFAGGCVRDRVLGLRPKDYDIATDAPPEQVIPLFPKAIPVGVQFGVVRVIVGGTEYEVATFRAEADYSDGRRPNEVRWADAEADVLRRDFTINGLLEDPLAVGEPEVLDFVGGRADLAAGVIRAIGDARERFLEDHLRLLRCVRFAARMRFTIEPATWAATCELAPLVAKVSPERIGEELDRIATQGNAARGLELALQAGLLGVVLPEVAGDLAVPMLARKRAIAACDSTVAWTAILLDVPGHVEAIALRLRWSNGRRRDVTEAIAIVEAIARWTQLSVADRKRAARRATFAQALAVAGVAGLADHDVANACAALAWSADELRPTPLLTGVDLKQRGHAPGPAFKDALEALETAQLEGRATTTAEAWQVVAPYLR